MRSWTWARRSGSPTTPVALGCTPKPGCSTEREQGHHRNLVVPTAEHQALANAAPSLQHEVAVQALAERHSAVAHTSLVTTPEPRNPPRLQRRPWNTATA